MLVDQWRYPLGRYSWEIVEGAAEPGEDGLSAITRELREEAGYEAARWELLADRLALSNSVTDEEATLYLPATSPASRSTATPPRSSRSRTCPSTTRSRWSTAATSPMRCRSWRS